MAFWKGDNQNILSEKEHLFIEGIISFKQSADTKNELVYRTNDGSKYNYIIPDVKQWQKMDNGHVLIECGRKIYDFKDTFLSDKKHVKDIADGYGDGTKMAMARVGTTFGEEINTLDSAYMVEVDKKTGEMKEIKPHQFDLCAHNHYIVGEYKINKDGKDINETIQINARDIKNILIEDDIFILKDNNDRVFATRGLEYELEIAKEEALRDNGYSHTTTADVLLKLEENTGKPIVILTSSTIIRVDGKDDPIWAKEEGEKLIGSTINIEGERIIFKTGESVDEPETTEILDVTFDSSTAYDLTIIEGEDSIYVSFDRFRELDLELTLEHGGPGGGSSGASMDYEYELYMQIISDAEQLRPEPEIEIYPDYDM